LPPPGWPAGDRLIQFLALVAVLLFVGRGGWRRGLGRPWEKWARWGAIAAFSAALLYALGTTLWWLLTAQR
jgi:hypothetical protein